MSFVDPKDPLWREVNSIAGAEGLELYDLERLPPSHLRVTIDRIKPEAADEVVPAIEAGLVEADEAQIGAAAESGRPVRERVSSGDCSKLCRRLMAFFLVEGPNYGIASEPEIEVSSPGVNRNLRRPEHFAAAVGERVRVVSMVEYAGAEKFPLVGTVIDANSEHLRLAIEGTDVLAALPLGQVRKAHVDFKFE